jgi:DNA-binding transcriptional regulator YiaG
VTKSVLREKFARLGPTLDDDRVSSGTQEVVSLRLGPDLSAARAISAVLALRKRHVPTLKAKRAVEAAIARRPVVLVAPMVEDLRRLAEELKESGFSMSVLTTKAVDVKRIRERLGMTQEQFALSFGLDVDAVRNWEYGRREPDLAAKSYLTVIDREPELAQEALAVPVL